MSRVRRPNAATRAGAPGRSAASCVPVQHVMISRSFVQLRIASSSADRSSARTSARIQHRGGDLCSHRHGSVRWRQLDAHLRVIAALPASLATTAHSALDTPPIAPRTGRLVQSAFNEVARSSRWRLRAARPHRTSQIQDAGGQRPVNWHGERYVGHPTVRPRRPAASSMTACSARRFFDCSTSRQRSRALATASTSVRRTTSVC